VGDPDLNPAEYDFIAARRRTEAKAKSAAEKLTSLEDAVGRVKDGDHIGVGGCLFSRTPMALMREILRSPTVDAPQRIVRVREQVKYRRLRVARYLVINV